jgi:phosphatidylserine/phosphatidylglycerophosphate/cardiolipin synthase-like enzyme
VADGRLAFITSANLTKRAMEGNMEIGILVRGGALPDNLHRHLEMLVAMEIIRPYKQRQ